MDNMDGSAGRWMAGFAGTAAALLLAACGGGGGDGGGSVAAQGQLSVAMTDAPACYKKVLVTVEKVRVQTSSTAAESDAGWQEIVPAGGPVQVDLLDLTNGKLAELGTTTVPAATYSQLRLVLADNTGANPLANAVQLNDGTMVALKTPSAQQSGLKIQGNFNVAADTTTPVLLDFDACKSIVVAGGSGQYILKPVVRLTERAKATGAIQGFVSTTGMVAADTTVSAQQDGAIVRSTIPDATGKFSLAYLPTGTYTVVITAPTHANGIVDSVPVGTGTVVLNGTPTAVVLPTSSMGTVTGTVTATVSSGNTTSTQLVTDATVTASQSIASKLVEIASTNVDFTTAMYTMQLPTAAPVRATWSSTTGLSAFTAAGTAGAYSLRATSPTKGATAPVSTTVNGTTTTTLNFSY